MTSFKFIQSFTPPVSSLHRGGSVSPPVVGWHRNTRRIRLHRPLVNVVVPGTGADGWGVEPSILNINLTPHLGVNPANFGGVRHCAAHGGTPARIIVFKVSLLTISSCMWRQDCKIPVAGFVQVNSLLCRARASLGEPGMRRRFSLEVFRGLRSRPRRNPLVINKMTGRKPRTIINPKMAPSPVGTLCFLSSEWWSLVRKRINWLTSL